MTRPNDTPTAAARHDLPSALVHDLRTPLGHVLGYAELVMERAQEAGHDDYARDLKKVMDAGHRLLALISENINPVRAEAEASADNAAPPGPTGQADPAGRPRPTAQTAPAEQLEPSAGEDPCAAGEPVAAGDDASVQTATGRVLVVDDVESNRDLLVSLLRRQGYAVATAVNGLDALAKLRGEAFDLVLLDIMMPEIDGFEVLRQLKADVRLRHIPVIMISALSDMDSVVRCIELGADDYLHKPFNASLLRARVGSCLEQKRGRDREAALHAQCQLAYRQLKRVEESRTDLTNMVLHDLRTPLTSMILGIQALELIGELSREQRAMLEISLAGGATLLGLINDMLDVDKLKSGDLTLDVAVLSPAELIASAVGQVGTLAARRKLTIVQRIAPALPELHGDADKLRRTLVNLLGNAVKFTPEGGTITVEAAPSEDGKSVIIAVTDTGEGIPQESLTRIFEKYGQVESRDGGRLMSTGLGLTFCRMAIEAHGGRIAVESTVGRGSTFRLAIPLSLAEPVADYAHQSSSPNSTASLAY